MVALIFPDQFIGLLNTRGNAVERAFQKSGLARCCPHACVSTASLSFDASLQRSFVADENEPLTPTISTAAFVLATFPSPFAGITVTRSRVTVAVLLALVACGALATTQLTLFVVPPIGALPEGKTVLISRLTNTQFVDSPDAICQRIQEGVSLLCRGMVIGRVLEEAKIYGRFPYSSSLYSISTGGVTYDR